MDRDQGPDDRGSNFMIVEESQSPERDAVWRTGSPHSTKDFADRLSMRGNSSRFGTR